MSEHSCCFSIKMKLQSTDKTFRSVTIFVADKGYYIIKFVKETFFECSCSINKYLACTAPLRIISYYS